MATVVKEAVPHQHFICWYPGLRLPGLQSCEKFTSSQYKLSSLRPFCESNLNSLLPLLSPPSSFLPPPDLPSSLFWIQTFQSRLLRWAKSCSTGFVSLANFMWHDAFQPHPSSCKRHHFIHLHSLMHGYHIFFIHPYSDGLPGWSQNLAVVSRATINVDCRSFLWLADFRFFRHYLELTDMAATYGSSIKTKVLKPITKYLFLRKLY